MNLQREDDLNEVKAWLVRFEKKICADREAQHQNSFKEMENTLRDLLNEVYGWELQNANKLFGVNQDSFDLVDKSNSIAVQVTVTTGATKVRKTLKKFIGKHDSTYERLCFVYPYINPSKVTADLSNDLGDFAFKASEDCLHFGSILREIQDKNVDGIRRVLELLRKELKPLGQALQYGVDKTMETLISVIQFMSENAPLKEIELDETKPDMARKIQRLQGHAEYLLDQFRSNQILHASIDLARDAIGYDMARATKIQAWLKSNSLDMLAENTNNAQQAFKGMVKDLLKQAHCAGSDAEETAVRFLLADEFVRCNLFPNPTK